MLARQCQEWNQYPEDVRVICVDDCSPEPAAQIIEVRCTHSATSIYRIETPIDWNRNGSRNLSSHVAETKWLLHVDIDHIVPRETVEWIVANIDTLDDSRWYRFKRFRVGKADETRRKDKLPEDCEFGEIHPHVDSFLCTRELFWLAGGYDEDFSGSLGGSSLFLKHMELNGGPAHILPEPLHVHTRTSVEDASDFSLSRDRSRYERIRAEKRRKGDPKPTSHLRFNWSRVL